MAADADGTGPADIETLDDLGAALARLRRQAARPGQLQLSLRDLAARTHRAASTLEPYLNGKRLCPADVYEDLLKALGVPADRLRPWLDAWDRVADARPARPAPGPRVRSGRPQLLPYSESFRYRIGEGVTLGVVTGDLRRVQGIDIWVNSENTDMRMSRFEEYSVSAVIRFEGARRDEVGRVVEDRVADELGAAVAGRLPVAPCTAISTGGGELLGRNGVYHIIHVAAVHGEPGEGYRQVLDVGRCVSNALAEGERLAAAGPARSILFPLLGTGVAGGDLEATVQAMVGAAIDHVATRRRPGLTAVHLLASTAEEREVCRAVLAANPRLAPA